MVAYMHGLKMTNWWHTISCKGGIEVQQEHEVGVNLAMEVYLQYRLSYPSVSIAYV